MVRFEVTMDQRGWRPGQPGGSQLHHGRDVIGQVGPRGCEKLSGLVQPSQFLPDLSRRRVDVEAMKLGNGPRRGAYRTDGVVAPADHLRERRSRNGRRYEGSQRLVI